MAALVRQSLVEAGVPVKCSESHLLAMRHGVLTVMSLLAALNGCGRLQAASRLLEVCPVLKFAGIERLCSLLENLAGWPTEVVDPVDYRVAEFLDLLQPLKRAMDLPDTQAAVETAVLIGRRLAQPTQQDDTSCHAAALSAWALTGVRLYDGRRHAARVLAPAFPVFPLERI